MDQPYTFPHSFRAFVLYLHGPALDSFRAQGLYEIGPALKPFRALGLYADAPGLHYFRAFRLFFRGDQILTVSGVRF